MTENEHHTIELLKLMQTKYAFDGLQVLESKDGTEIQLSMSPAEMTVFLDHIRVDAIAAHVVEELHAEPEETPDDQS